MATLRDFVGELLERHGAAVEPDGPDGLGALLPPELRAALALPEDARLAFGGERPAGSVFVGLDDDWLDRLGGLLGARGRHAEWMAPADATPPPGDPETLAGQALELANAVWRHQGIRPGWTRLRVMLFRWTAVSDEKREGVFRLGVNFGTGAVLDSLVDRLMPMAGAEDAWLPPTPEILAAAPAPWPATSVEATVRRALPARLAARLDPFLRGMRRRLERDAARLHTYHDDLFRQARARHAAAKDDAARAREDQRMDAVAREYRAKLDDLRHNFALEVTVECVQTVDLLIPVRRLSVLIRRRKGERVLTLDWHPAARRIEPAVCEAGAGLDPARLVCDAALHLTSPAAQDACPACGKAYCRACAPDACPGCGHRPAAEGIAALATDERATP